MPHGVKMWWLWGTTWNVVTLWIIHICAKTLDWVSSFVHLLFWAPIYVPAPLFLRKATLHQKYIARKAFSSFLLPMGRAVWRCCAYPVLLRAGLVFLQPRCLKLSLKSAAFLPFWCLALPCGKALVLQLSSTCCWGGWGTLLGASGEPTGASDTPSPPFSFLQWEELERNSDKASSSSIFRAPLIWKLCGRKGRSFCKCIFWSTLTTTIEN